MRIWAAGCAARRLSWAGRRRSLGGEEPGSLCDGGGGKRQRALGPVHTSHQLPTQHPPSSPIRPPSILAPFPHSSSLNLTPFPHSSSLQFSPPFPIHPSPLEGGRLGGGKASRSSSTGRAHPDRRHHPLPLFLRRNDGSANPLKHQRRTKIALRIEHRRLVKPGAEPGGDLHGRAAGDADVGLHPLGVAVDAAAALVGEAAAED